MLTESMKRGQAWLDTMAPHKPRRTQLARVQEGCMPSEPSQASCRLLAAGLQTRWALAIHSNQRDSQATWPNATKCLQPTTAYELFERRRGSLAGGPLMHYLGKTATHPGGKPALTVHKAKPQRGTGQLSTASRKLDTIIVREGNPMFWQLLARLIPRRRPWRTRTPPTVETVTPEPPYDTVLAEVYSAHAAIHGANMLLPRHTLPSSSRCHTPEKPKAPPW